MGWEQAAAGSDEGKGWKHCKTTKPLQTAPLQTTSAAGAHYSSSFYKTNTNPQKTGLGEPQSSVHPFSCGLSPWAAPDGHVLDLQTSGDGASCTGATAGGQRIVKLLVGWWWLWVFYN